MTTASGPRRLTSEQRDSLWKWRWLGWRGSTAAFKVSMAVLAVAALGLVMIAASVAVAAR
jgi:hypothetical protein